MFRPKGLYVLLFPPKSISNNDAPFSCIFGFDLCNPIWVNNHIGPVGQSKAHLPILNRSSPDLLIAVINPPLTKPSVALSTPDPNLSRNFSSPGLATSGKLSFANKPLYK